MERTDQQLIGIVCGDIWQTKTENKFADDTVGIGANICIYTVTPRSRAYSTYHAMAMTQMQTEKVHFCENSCRQRIV